MAYMEALGHYRVVLVYYRDALGYYQGCARLPNGNHVVPHSTTIDYRDGTG